LATPARLWFAVVLCGACDDRGPAGADGGTPCGCPQGQFCVAVDAGVGQECIDECAAGHAPCGAGVDGEATCCGFSQQCCASATYGYGYAHDLCAPADGPCPMGCEPGLDCGEAYCRYDPPTDSYACTDECQGGQRCGDSVCCPLGTQCLQGGCPLPDLTVDGDFADAQMAEQTFPADHCAVVEGCVGAPGTRRLLRFNTRTPNLGPGDLHLGSPEDSALFEHSPCHGHYHFTGYADYRLLDLAGTEVGAGHKQAFCLVDLDCPAGMVGDYRCDFQGISAGCADIYSQALDCQWVDVTDVPSGQYRLVIEINGERLLAEADYTNNVAEVPVVVCRAEIVGDCEMFSSCPGGCDEPDLACCTDGDPCGRAADGVCDCDATQSWDEADCAFCACAP